MLPLVQPTPGWLQAQNNDRVEEEKNSLYFAEIISQKLSTLAAEKILDNKNASSSHSIDISNSNDGVYIIQLLQGDKKTMHKVIKE